MDRKTWAFVLAGLALSVALAAFVSPFACSSPDGLDKFAQDREFEDKAEGSEAWAHAPLADYKAPGIGDERVSTAVAGVAGTLLVFACAWGLAKVMARKKPAEPERRSAP